jgi:dTDP-4-dehydrorhamnose reductase
MNILITGSNGQLGQELKKLSKSVKFKAKHKFFFTDVEDLDITSSSDLRSFVQKNKIKFIVNCAAYTAVDKAEGDAKNAELVNRIGPGHLAGISREYDIPLIHVSTDFVFDGKKSSPYVETDTANPISVYAKTKLEGEQEIIKRASTFVIIRTSWLYSEFGANFVKTILRLSKEKKELNIVFDQIGTPTYAKDLALAIMTMVPKIRKGTRGIFHYSNEGVASWYDFAKAVLDITASKCKIRPIEAKDYPVPAKRPAYSAMNKAKIKEAFKLEIPYWRDSLKKCLDKM